VIAEKFEAMISLSVDNSQMKDFFDVYGLLKHHDIDMEVLGQAIEATFSTRNTQMVKNPALFTESFAKDARRNNYFQGFLKRIKWKEKLEFSEVCSYIVEKLKPYYEQMFSKRV